MICILPFRDQHWIEPFFVSGRSRSAIQGLDCETDRQAANREAELNRPDPPVRLSLALGSSWRSPARWHLAVAL